MEDADVLVPLSPAVAAARPVEDVQHWPGRLDGDGHACSPWQPKPNREDVSRRVGSLDQEEARVPPGAEANDSRLCRDTSSNRKRSVGSQGANGYGRPQGALLATRGEIDKIAYQLEVAPDPSGKRLARVRTGTGSPR